MKYDIICIGAGSGGLNIAGFMNRAGFKVLLIDKSDKNIGGDCLNFGCVPSKALLHIGQLAKDANEVQKFDLKMSGTINMQKVADYISGKKEFIREHENATYFRSKGMDVELGTAKFSGPNSIIVNGKEHHSKRIVLATGSRPRKLKIPGIDKVDILTNETIFENQTLPKKLLIIGAGPIGMELGQAYQRLGSQVTIIQNTSQFLPKENPILAKILQKQLQSEGIEFLFETKTLEFTNSNTISLELPGGRQEYREFDQVLVSIGRELNIENLDLEKAGIQLDKTGRKLLVNEFLQTTNKNVFVCGDVVGAYQFTHAAELHAATIIKNFFSPFKKKISYDKLSWVTYTDPQIATFGLNEKQLTKRNIKFETIETDFAHDDRAIVDEATVGKTILYISNKKLLGGSMIAKNAGELFQELVLANTADLTTDSLFAKVYPYPTATRINKTAISSLYAKKLTPFSKKLLKWLY